jgi:hypothetical protein
VKLLEYRSFLFHEIGLRAVNHPTLATKKPHINRLLNILAVSSYSLRLDGWSVLRIGIFVGSSCEEMVLLDVLLLGIPSCVFMRALG